MRKYEDMLSTIEESKEKCQTLQSEKEDLVLLVNIIEGEKKGLEKQIMEVVTEGGYDKQKNRGVGIP